MKKPNLICTQCTRTYPGERVHPRCDTCNEPLEVEKVIRGKIKSGMLQQTILERYRDFFPFLDSRQSVSLYEGFTPLVESAELADELHVKRILCKNETQNPTWSFKDRGTVVGVHHALSLGYKRIGAVSTGNMAVSVAAYGARAGLQTLILVSANLPAEKLAPIAVYNPVVIQVEGDYAQLYLESLNIGKEHNIYFINSDVPARVEGSKTIAFEICEQLDFDMPNYVIVPTSSGGNIRGILKGFEEFKRCGLIHRVPRIICAQASGCSPIYNAYTRNEEHITRVENPETIAHALENPYPPSGNEVLRKIRLNGGRCVAVSDEEILHAERELATRVGIFGQPAAAVALAAVKRLSKENSLSRNDTVVCIVTGSGLKYMAALEKHSFKIHTCRLDNFHKFIKGMM
jgi:threonine synthase